jgi:hypothetical protein
MLGSGDGDGDVVGWIVKKGVTIANHKLGVNAG